MCVQASWYYKLELPQLALRLPPSSPFFCSPRLLVVDVCLCTSVCAHVYVWRSEVDAGYLFYFLPLHFPNKVAHWIWSLLFQPEWASWDLPMSPPPCHPHPSTGVTKASHCAKFLHACWGPDPRSSCLAVSISPTELSPHPHPILRFCVKAYFTGKWLVVTTCVSLI